MRLELLRCVLPHLMVDQTPTNRSWRAFFLVLLATATSPVLAQSSPPPESDKAYLYQCRAQYGELPNIIFIYENVYLVPKELSSRTLFDLEGDYRQALSDNPQSVAAGLGEPSIRCDNSFRDDSPVGAETNEHGTRTFVRSPEFLRGGKGYLRPQGLPKTERTNQGAKTVGQNPRVPGLVIEKAGPTPAEIAAERAKWNMEAVRADAVARAKTATLQAQNDAKYQADLAKLYEEMRKRGSAQ
jgi:hypothetical protein